jgi:hypothetical protein
MLSRSSLAIFRIALAATVILDLFWRFFDLGAHYSDLGLLPRAILFERHWNIWNFSLHAAHGQAWFQGLLFLIAMVAAGAMLIGYRTRLATIISWLLLVSLQNRNPIILDGGDVMLRMLLFWSIFLSLSERFSVDQLHHKTPDQVPSYRYWVPELCLMLQVAYVYVFAGIIKYYEPSWKAGTGLYYAFATDQFSTSLGKWIANQSWDLSLLNHSVVYAETFAPLLLFIPFATHWFRLSAVIIFWGMHLSIVATLNVGLFSLIGMVGWIGFIPEMVWQKIGVRCTALHNLFNRILVAASKFFQPAHQMPIKNRFRKPMGDLSTVIVAALGILVGWYNLSTIPQLHIRFPSELHPISSTLRLDQKWSMFSRPFLDDGWLVMPGLLADDSIVDLHSIDYELKGDIPELISNTYISQRWRKYLTNITARNYQKDRMELARYHCRIWNEANPPERRLETFHITFMQLWNKPERQHEPAKPMLLWRHECRSGMLTQKENQLYKAVLKVAANVAVPPKEEPTKLQAH